LAPWPGLLISATLVESKEETNERKGAKEMRTLETSWRLAGLIAVLVLATGITAASAQTKDRKARANAMELTYTKWFSPGPGPPHMVGVVGRDIAGKFGGAVLDATSDAPNRFRLKAIYIVLADDPSRSLTIRVQGTEESGTAVLNGRVIDGRLTGARVRAQYTVIPTCEESPAGGPCFQGTISVKQRDGD
jgi:hypothetical protein